MASTDAGLTNLVVATYSGNTYTSLAVGSSGYISTAIQANTAVTNQNFTLEFWVNFNDYNANVNRCVYNNYTGTFGANCIYIGKHTTSNGNLSAWFGSVSTGTFSVQESSLPPAGWNHYAITRNGANLTLFRNGNIQSSNTNFSTTILTGITNFDQIGGNAGGGSNVLGYISGMRMVKGSVLYTANFSVNAAPLNNLFSSTSTTIPSNGNSVAFVNSATSYLNVASSPFVFGTNAFTAECWIYTPSLAATQVFIDNWSYTSFAIGQWTMYLNTTGTVTFSYATSTSAQTNITTTTPVVAVNTWTHIAAVRTSTSSNGFVIYINGTAGVTATLSASIGVNSINSSIGILTSNKTSPFNGYISSVRLTNALAVYTGAFTVPTGPLTATQSSGTNISAISGTSVTLLTCQTLPILNTPTTTNGYYYNSFNGSSQYLIVPANAAFTFGTGDFTVEAWINFNTGSVYNMVFENGGASGGDTSGFSFGVNTSNQLYMYTNGSTVLTGTSVLLLNTWYHVAIVRLSGTITLYSNGVSVGTTSTAYNFTGTGSVSGGIQIGKNAGTTSFMHGYMSNYRVVKGVAVYTGAFAPSTSPLSATQSSGTNIAAITGTSTSLLTCQSSTIIDNSSYTFSITNSATPVTASVVSGLFNNYNSYIADNSTFAYNVGNTGIYTSLNNPFGGSATVLLTAQTNSSNANLTFTDTSVANSTIINYGASVAKNTPLFTTGNITLTPTFATGNLSYTANVGSNITAITMTPTANDAPNATIRFNGNVTMSSGNATITTNAPYVANGGYSISDSGGMLLLANAAPFNIQGYSWTAEMWVNVTGNYTNYNDLFAKRVGSSSTTTYQGYLAITTGYIGFYNGTVYNSTYVLQPNVWNHVAYTYDGNTVSIYVNGTQVYSVVVGILADNAGNLTIGGTVGNTEWLIGNASNFRFTKGYVLYQGGSFTVPTQPYGLTQPGSTNAITNANTSLLSLQNSTTTDASSNAFTLTVTGTPTVSTSITPFPLSSTSVYFDGSTGYLSIANNALLDVGSNNFTFECFIYPISFNAVDGGFMAMGPQSGSASWVFRGYANGSLEFNTWVSGTTSDLDIYSSANAITFNTWNHVAVTRNGTSFIIWANGVNVASGTSSNAIGNAGRPGYLGYGYSSSSGRVQNCYLSNVRWINGTAIYTANFTPSTTPLTAIVNTVLLTCRNYTISDSSVNNFAITVNGAASLNSLVYPRFVQPNGSSVYFTGSTQYLNAPSNSVFTFGTGNFTIEGWIYLASGTNSGTLFDNRTASNSVSPQIYISSNIVYYAVGGTNVITGSTVTANTWYHIAVVRISNLTTLYVNGYQSGSTYVDNNNYVIGSPYIGTGYNTTNPLNGYISNIRVVKGVGVYTNTFGVSKTPLTITQSQTTNTLAITGAPSNGYSAYFNGTNGYLNLGTSSALNFGTGNFTIEFWVYPNTTSQNSNAIVLGNGNATWSAGAVNITLGSSTGKLCFAAYDYSSSNPNFLIDSASFVANQWTHYAITRNGNTFTMYRNGTSVATTTTFTGNINLNNNNKTFIGGGDWDGATSYFNGYISNLRIINSTVLYTTNFTPSAAPLTAITNTVLLAIQNSLMNDASTNNYTLTVNGGASLITTISPYNVAQAGSTQFSSASVQYLSATNPYNPALSMGADSYNNFTAEAWIYMNGLPPASPGWYIMQKGVNATYGVEWSLSIYASTTYYMFFQWQNALGTFGTTNSGSSNTINLTVGQWNHMAITKVGTTITFWFNGRYSGSVNGVTNLYYSTNSVFTIANTQTGATTAFNGYISNARIVYGAAIYTADYQVGFNPTNIGLLSTTQSATSTTAAIQNASSYINSLGYSIYFNNSTDYLTFTEPVNNFYSALFDGTSNYLTVATSNITAFGTGDFTIESWVYHIGAAPGGGVTYDRFIFGGFTTAPSCVFFLTNNNLALALWDGTTQWTSSSTVTPNTWTHVAVSKVGTVLYYAVNGVVTSSTGFTTNFTASRVNYIGRDDAATDKYFPGYISNLRVVKGTGLYSTNFTPSTTPLTKTSQGAIASQVVLLALQSPTFVDNSVSALTITNSGTVVASTYNPYSLYNGNDVTIEAWVMLNAAPTTAGFIINNNASSTGYFGISINTARTVSVFSDSTATAVVTSANLVPLNQWAHVAVVFNNSTIYIYINGVKDANSVAKVSLWGATASGLVYIGRQASAAAQYFPGYMTNVRMVYGSALYLVKFTPPTSPLTAITNTMFLGLQSNATTDASTNNYTVTKNGTGLYLSTMNSPFATYMPTIANGNSITLGWQQGASPTDYMTLTPGYVTAFQIPGDFTLETWLYMAVVPSGYVSVIDYRSTGTDAWVFGLQTGAKVDFYWGSAGRLTANTSLAANTWYHIAATRKNGVLNLWLNGVLDATVANVIDFGTRTATSIRYGALIDPAYWSGYLNNTRFINGTAIYTGTFIPSTAPYSLTSSSGTNTLAVTGITTYPTVNTPIGLTYSGSLYFGGGSTSYTSIPNSGRFNLDTYNFTIEAWFYSTSASSITILSAGSATTTDYAWALNIVKSTTTYFTFISYTGFGQTNTLSVQSPTTTVNLNSWYHIALVRNGSSITFYLNGINIGVVSLTYGQLLGLTSQPFVLGNNTNSYTSNGFYGYISNARVIRGYAVYTGNFTPSTSPLTNTQNAITNINAISGTTVSLLALQNSVTTDASSNAFTLTATGSPTLSTTVFPNFTLINGYSGFFDGSTTYLTIPNSTTVNLLGFIYTIEAWVYTATIPASVSPIINKTTGSSGWSLRINNTGRMSFVYPNVGFTDFGPVLSTNTWYHVAVASTNGSYTSLYGYVNGVQYSITMVGTSSDIATLLTIGYESGSNTYFNGYLSNVRIVRGIAVYTGNFTLPTTPLTVSQSSSTNINAISTNAYSVLFSGSNYLTIASNANFALTANYTIELWYYLTSAPTSSYQCIFSTGSNNFFLQYNNTNFNIGKNLVGPTVAFNYGFTINQWYHIAVARSGSVVYGFVNGVLISSGIDTTSWAQSGVTLGALVGGAQLCTGYISNFRLVNGTALYTSSFTPSTSQLTAVANTQLLTCQSPIIYDNSANGFTITNTGSPVVYPAYGLFGTGVTQLLVLQNSLVTDASVNNFTLNIPANTRSALSTLTPFSTNNNGYSGQFNGNLQYLYAPASTNWQFGSNNFTVELWANINQVSAQGTVFVGPWGIPGGTNRTWIFALVAGSGIAFIYSTTGTNATSITTSFIPTLNTWYHLAAVRNGNTLTIYANGTSIGSGSVSGVTFYNGTNNLYIGYNSENSTAGGYYDMNGNISNIRIVNGVAVYTGNFTVPTGPLTTTQSSGTNISAITGTSTVLLALQNGLTDVSSNNYTLMMNNYVSLSNKSPFSIAGNGYSVYFSGSSQYLNAPSNAVFTFGTNNFTIEGWIYLSSGTSTGTLFDNRTSSTSVSSQVYINANTVYYAVGGTIAITGTTITAGTWYHIAVVRISNVTTMYVNGAKVGTSYTDSNNYAIGSTYIGTGYNTSYPLNGYISNLRITNGTGVYSYQFTPSLLPLASTQSSSSSVIQLGNGAPQTFGNSVYFNGTTDYMKASGSITTMSTGDFTIETYYYPTSFAAVTTLFGQYTAATTGLGYWNVQITTGGYIYVYYNGSTATSYSLPILINEWVHIAIVRISGTITLYVNGLIGPSVSFAGQFGLTSVASPLYIGATQLSGPTQYALGYMSNLRITKGLGVYTGAFTVPTSTLSTTQSSGTNIAAITGTSVSLLMYQNSLYGDNSTFNYNITVIGNPQYSPVFSPSYFSYPTPVNGNSVYFNGTSSYLSLTQPSNAGTGHFTIEMWIYPTSISAIGYLLSTSTTAANCYHLWVATTGAITLAVDSATASITSGTPSFAKVNAWTHIAITRSNNVVYMYVNGVLQATTLSKSTQFGDTGVLNIGRYQPSTNQYFTGYITNIRYVYGTSLYIGSYFTPPYTAPLTNILNTTLLLAQTTVSKDNSANNVTITNNSAILSTYTNPYTMLQLPVVLTAQSGTTGVARDNSMYVASVTNNAIAYSSYNPTVSPYGVMPSLLLAQSTNSLYNDNSMNNYALVPTTTVAFSPTVMPYVTPFNGNNSIAFSGSTSYVTGTNLYNTFGGDFTIEFFMMAPPQTASVFSLIMGRNTAWSSTTNNNWYIGCSSPNGAYKIPTQTITFANYQTSTSSPVYVGTTVVCDSKWHHIAIVRISNIVTVYVDGVADVGQLSTTNSFYSSGVWDYSNYTIGSNANDGGSTVAQLAYNGLLSNLRTINGVGIYTGNFTKPTNNLTTTQSAGTNIVAFNPTIPSTTGYSWILNSIASSYVTISPIPTLNFGFSDYTIELWHFLTGRPTSSTTPCLFSNYSSFTTGSLSMFAGHGSSVTTKYQIAFNGTSFPSTALVSNTNIIYGKWTHIAVVRKSGIVYLYINGVLDSSITPYGNYNVYSNVNTWYIGAAGDNTSASYISGLISNFRVTTGIAVYTGNFTTPSLALTTTQSSGTNISAISTSLITNGGAVWYSGGGNSGYQFVPANYVLNAGLSNLTVESWVYLIVMPTSNTWTTGVSVLVGSDSALTNGVHFVIGASTLFVTITNTIYGGFVHNMTSATWYHLAYVNINNNMTFYVNGVAIGTASNLPATATTATSVYIGTALSTSGYGLNGYISNLRILKSIGVYSGNFTPSITPLTNTQTTVNNINTVSGSSTSLLALQSSTTTDASSNTFTLTATGSPTVNNTVYPDFIVTNGYSAYMQVTASNVSSLQAPSTASISGIGTFTIECWIYPLPFNSTSYQVIVGNDTSGGLSAFGIYINGTIFYGTALVNILGTTTTPVTFNAWNHIALVRSAGTISIYINGFVAYTGTNTQNYTAGIIRIGTDGGGTNYPYTGYISNLRIVNGVAVYSGSSFTPPTGVLTATQSANSNGNPSATLNTNAYAASLNGTNQYLYIPANGGLQFGTGNFTIELWVFNNSFSTNPVFYATNGFGVNIQANTSGVPIYYLSSAGASYDIASGVSFGSTLSVTTWYHLALVRNGNTITPYVNGISGSPVTTSSAIFYPAGAITEIGYGSTYTNGYISNVRVTKGVAVYTGNFTAPSSNLSVTQGSGTNISAISNPILSTGYYALLFNGNGGSSQYLSLSGSSMVFGTSAFTVECWVFVNSFTSAPVVVDNFVTGGSGSYTTNQWQLIFTSGGTLQFNYATSTSAITTVVTTTTVSLSTWTHIAAVRTSTSANGFVIYINGVVGVTATLSQSIGVNATSSIGVQTYNKSNGMNGFISNIRLTNGVAVYGSAFNVPQSPLTLTQTASGLTNAVTGTQTSLLALQNSATNDASTNNFTLTATGGPTLALTPSPFPSTAATQISAYFTGGYLSIPYSTAVSNAFFFGTNNFTIEFWIYCVTPWTSMSNPGIGSMRTSDGTGGWVIYKNGSVNTTVMNIRISPPGGSTSDYPANSAPSTGVWEHWAVVRNSGTLTWYRNGNNAGTYTGVTTNIYDTTGNFYLGYTQTWGGVFNTGYLSNYRVVNGTAVYTSNFTPPVSPFAPLQAANINGNPSSAITTTTTFLGLQTSITNDASSNGFTLTVNGSVASNSSTYPSLVTYVTNGASIYFTGNTQYINAPSNSVFTFGTNNFTIEGWIYLAATTTSGTLFDNRTASNSVSPQIYISSNTVYYAVGGTNVITGGTITTGVWYHIAIVRISTTTTMYVNGAVSGSAYTDSNNYVIGSPYIGSGFGNSNSLNGYMSNLRVVNGVGIYTTAFATPTQPLTATQAAGSTYASITSGQVTLLTAQNSTIIDNSTYNNLIVNTGSVSSGVAYGLLNNNTGVSLLTLQNSTVIDNSLAVISITNANSIVMQPAAGLFGTSFTQLLALQNSITNDAGYYNLTLTPNGLSQLTVRSPFVATNGSSIQFTGSSQYINAPSNSVFTFGTNNFTIEGWIYLAALSLGSGTLYDNRTSSNSVSPQIYINQYTVYYAVGGTAVITGSNLSILKWYHIALVRVSGITTLYVNGAKVGASYTDSNNYTVVGSPYFGTGYNGSYPLNGYISNVRVINGTGAYLYNFTIPTSPLSISQSSSTSTKALVSLPTNYYSGYFEGTTSYITTPTTSSGSVLIIGSSPFTIEAWVYMNTLPASSAIYTIMQKGTLSSTLEYSFAIYNTGSVYQLYHQYSTNGSTNVTMNSSTINLLVNTWFHVAMTRVGATVTFYFNGTQLTTTGTGATSYYVGSIGLGIGATPTGTNFFNGFISNARLVNGIAVYTSTFTVPSTILAKTQTSSTNISAITGLSSNSGYYDLVFSNSASQYLSLQGAPYVFGTNPFTIECWVYPISFAGTPVVIDNWINSSGSYLTGQWQLIFTTSGTLQFNYATSVSAFTTVVTTNTALVYTWTHIAAVRLNTGANGFTIYINGVAGVTATLSQTIGATPISSIGIQTNTKTLPFYGYVSNIRLTYGVGVYTNTFTPPTSPLAVTQSGGTPTQSSLLALQSSVTTDASTNNFTLTNIGGVTLSATTTTTPFPLSLPATGASAYFDGNSYLSYPGNTWPGESSVALTVEFWMYMTVLPPTSGFFGIFESRSSGGTTGIAINVNTGSGSYGTGFITFVQAGVGVGMFPDKSLVANTWYHIATSRNSSYVQTWYINGVLQSYVDNWSTSSSFGDAGDSFTIGKVTGDTNFQGYISNLRIVDGFALYTASFTPITSPLTNVTGTVFLGLQSSVTVPTVGSTMSITGTVTLSTTYSPFFYVLTGGNSAYFTGSSQYLNAPSSSAFTFGTNNFTIEGWIYLASGTTGTLYDSRTSSNSVSAQIYINSSVVYYAVAGTNVITGATLSATTWYHIAVVRNSGSTKLYVNGTQSGSTYTDSNNYVIGSPYIGTGYNLSYPLNGYISNLRVMPGAVYTANFTSPTSPLAASLSLGTSITAISAPTTSNGYYALSFTGNTLQYVSVPGTPVVFGTSAFTIECWVYVNSFAGTPVVIDNFVTGGSGSYTTSQWQLIFTTTGTLQFNYATSASAITTVVTTSTVSVGVWTHIAAVRTSTSSNGFVIYINGVAGVTATLSASIGANATSSIGIQTYSKTLPMLGFISNVRLTSGVAVYTGAFTPQTSPLAVTQSSGTNIAAISGTSVTLLTAQSSTVVDNSTFTYTLIGSATTPFIAYGLFNNTGVTLLTGQNSTIIDNSVNSSQIINTGAVTTGQVYGLYNTSVTALLALQSALATDASIYNFPLTITGSTQLERTFSPFGANAYNVPSLLTDQSGANIDNSINGLSITTVTINSTVVYQTTITPYGTQTPVALLTAQSNVLISDASGFYGSSTFMTNQGTVIPVNIVHGPFNNDVPLLTLQNALVEDVSNNRVQLTTLGQGTSPTDNNPFTTTRAVTGFLTNLGGYNDSSFANAYIANSTTAPVANLTFNPFSIPSTLVSVLSLQTNSTTFDGSINNWIWTNQNTAPTSSNLSPFGTYYSNGIITLNTSYTANAYTTANIVVTAGDGVTTNTYSLTVTNVPTQLYSNRVMWDIGTVSNIIGSISLVDVGNSNLAETIQNNNFSNTTNIGNRVNGDIGIPTGGVGGNAIFFITDAANANLNESVQTSNFPTSLNIGNRSYVDIGLPNVSLVGGNAVFFFTDIPNTVSGESVGNANIPSLSVNSYRSSDIISSNLATPIVTSTFTIETTYSYTDGVPITAANVSNSSGSGIYAANTQIWYQS